MMKENEWDVFANLIFPHKVFSSLETLTANKQTNKDINVNMMFHEYIGFDNRNFLCLRRIQDEYVDMDRYSQRGKTLNK